MKNNVPYIIGATAPNIETETEALIKLANPTASVPSSSLHNMFWNYLSKQVNQNTTELEAILTANSITPSATILTQLKDLIEAGIKLNIKSENGTKVFDRGTDGTDATFIGTAYGTMKRIYSNTLNVDTSSVTITNLNLMEKKQYKLVVMVQKPDMLQDSGIYLRLNNLTATYINRPLVYGSSGIISVSASGGFFIGNIIPEGGLTSDSYTETDIVLNNEAAYFYSKGMVRFNDYANFSNAGLLTGVPVGTSIDTFSITSTTIPSGTRIELWERQ